MGWSMHIRAVAISAAAAAIIAFGATSSAAGVEIAYVPSSGLNIAAQPSEPATGEPEAGDPDTGASVPPTPDEQASEQAPEPSTGTEAEPEPEVGLTPEPESTTESRNAAPRSAEAAAPLAQATAASVITPFGPGVHRLAGADRYETAVAVSQRFGPGVPVLYVATGANFPDALTAAAAAAHQGAPLLLTQADVLPVAVRGAIERLAPQRIVVAGGEIVVGSSVYSELAGLTPTIVRLGGADRFETGHLLVADAFTDASQAFVATGHDFPDALAASAAAGPLAAPVFLVDGLAQSVRLDTVDSLRALGVRTVRIAGGSNAVSTAIERDLAAHGFSVLRHEGADRYSTAATLVDDVFSAAVPRVTSAFLATGIDFADALTGAALAGGLGAPLYITRPDCIPRPVVTSIDALAPTARVLLGGPAAIGDAVAASTICPAGWAKPASGRITDVFGPRAPICTPGGCSQSFHRGVDLGTGCWAPIYAASEGRVTTAGRVGTYGNFVKISHGPGIDTGYAHLVDGGVLVSVGQFVSAGEQIGWSGDTGAAFGCHLHFEVYQGGVQIDPIPFMSARGVVLG